jgi:hypothetical protein
MSTGTELATGFYWCDPLSQTVSIPEKWGLRTAHTKMNRHERFDPKVATAHLSMPTAQSFNLAQRSGEPRKHKNEKGFSSMGHWLNPRCALFQRWQQQGRSAEIPHFRVKHRTSTHCQKETQGAKPTEESLRKEEVVSHETSQG